MLKILHICAPGFKHFLICDKTVTSEAWAELEAAIYANFPSEYPFIINPIGACPMQLIDPPMDITLQAVGVPVISDQAYKDIVAAYQAANP